MASQTASKGSGKETRVRIAPKKELSADDFIYVRILLFLVLIPGLILLGILGEQFQLTGVIIGVILIFAYMIPLSRKIRKRVTGR